MCCGVGGGSDGFIAEVMVYCCVGQIFGLLLRWWRGCGIMEMMMVKVCVVLKMIPCIFILLFI
jgi:hypothetical protein